MSKLLWHSNAPWAPTGYGVQSALFAPGIAEHYDLAFSSFYGLEGAPLTWDGIPVFPGMGGDYGDQTLLSHAQHYFGGDARGGLVVTLMDVWVLNPEVMGQLNTAAWVPVDHEPAPPKVVDYLVQSNAVPIAMSRFGQQMLGRLDPLYVPHAVDTSIYKPFEARAEIRAKAFPEDAFVVGMVAANKGRPSRKGFPQALQAFKRLSDAHDNAYLYLHTMVNANLAAGEDIPALIRALDIPVERVRFADQYHILFDPYSHADMAKIFSAMDVLVNPSLGEGFGVPVLEAQACGVPVVVTDFSAMREVCGAGWQVKHTPYWTGLNSWQAVPDVDDIASALEECYGRTPAQREVMAQTARKHALNYALPKVLKQHMLPALRQAEQRFSRQQPVRIAPRLKAAA